jgi:hypothetical protein
MITGKISAEISWILELWGVPSVAKNKEEANQIDKEGSATLKRTLSISRRCLQPDIISASSATVTVAAGVPNKKTQVNTNVSETEIVAGTDGTLMVKKPLNSASAAIKSQLGLGGVLVRE